MESAEKCPDCGRDIRYETIEFHGHKEDFRITCQCEVERRENEKAENLEKGKRLVMESMRKTTGLKKRQRNMTFTAFDPKPEQLAVFNECKRYADEWTRDTQTGLLLIGAVGSGKTHLAAAICNRVIDRAKVGERDSLELAEGFGELREFYSGIRFVSTVDLFEEIKSAFGDDGDSEAVIENYKKTRLLVLDDLGAEKPTDWVRERLFEIIDHRYNEMLPIVTTTNLTTNELKEVLGDRTADRLRSMCKAVVITAPSQRISA